MQWFDWLIVIVPLLFVYFMGIYSRRYLKDITTFLSAGRVCGRYVISVGDIANALSIIGLLTYIEIHYKTGFAVGFWSSVTLPIGVLMGLFGYCTYRFRETKAQSLGQFLELRYSRKLRIFAAALRSFSEILANMIMPALAARFFIYFLGLPAEFPLLGMTVNTFDFIMVFVLCAAISIICMGGATSIIITDTIQGFICYPLMVLFVIFVLYKFSWSNEILPVVSERIAGESYLNPYDVYKLKDFNFFSVVVLGVFSMFMHRASWIGCGGSSTAARSPHEQKMASLLGTWRGAIGGIFYVLLAVALMTFLCHKNFEKEAHNIRMEISGKIAHDVVKDTQVRTSVLATLNSMKPVSFQPGMDNPLSDKSNVDTSYLNRTHEALVAQLKAQIPAGSENTAGKLQKAEDSGNKLFQQFRTLYYQQMLPVALRRLLPPGLLGMFCLLMILAMISTDDTRIFSATVTISQDVVLPFIKKELTLKQHMWILRGVAIAIGVVFFFGSKYMAQLDYIQMYTTLVCTMWMGGCGPVMIFGLYGKFGSTIGAWTSLLAGTFMAVVGIAVQRNWADVVIPFLREHNLIESVGNALETLSRPFNPWIEWKMDLVKCPINSMEWYLITMIVTLTLYIVVSFLTQKEPFNMDRMLHRGKYAIDGVREIKSAWNWKNLYDKLIGITPEYSFFDRCIAWFYFCYSIIYRFIGMFLLVIIWNAFYRWPTAWWGNYFLISSLVIPGILASITAVWFTIGGVKDLIQMFHDLEARAGTPLDDGRVEGNVSLADKAKLEAIEKAEAENK